MSDIHGSSVAFSYTYHAEEEGSIVYGHVEEGVLEGVILSEG